MTCVIALRHGGVVHMGGDAAITSEVVHTNGAKLVHFPSGLVAGFAGSLTTQNLLSRPDSKVATLNDLSNDAEVNAAFDQLQSVAHFQVKGAPDAAFWATLLLAKGSSVVFMANLGGWYRLKDEFRCIGDGSAVATGAMHALRGSAPRERIERALEAASSYVAGVGTMSAYETTASD